MSRGCIVVLFVLLGSTGARSQQAEQPVPSKEQILDCWREALRTVSDARVRITKEYYFARDENPVNLTQIDRRELVHFGRSYLFNHSLCEIQEGKEKEIDGRRDIANTIYQATLKQGQQNKQWSLVNYAEGERTFGPNAKLGLLPWLICFNQLLPEWFSNPRIQVVKVTRPDPSNPTIVRVTLRLNEVGLSRDEADAQTVKRGYFDFDEFRYFCPLRYELARKTRHSEWVETATFEYAPSKGLPILQLRDVSSPSIRSEKLGMRHSREVETYEIEYNPSLDEKIFWLSNYGLPEPPGVTPPRGTPRYVWFLMAAGVLTVLGILFRIRAARTHQPSGAAP